jgi:hypothetical protein
MSEEKKGITRREFISKSIKGAGIVGFGGAVGLAARRFLRGGSDKGTGGIMKASGYDLEELSAIDPALIRYKETGKINTSSRSLHAVAVGPDDRIYLAADKAVHVFGADTTRLSELKLSDSPRCLTVTEDSIVYMGMRDHVEVHHPKGLHELSWDGLGENAVLTSIAVSENHVFVADAGNRLVMRYDASGKLVRCIGRRDESRNIPGFSVPSPYFDLTASPDGLLRVANPGQHRVEAYTFDGDLEFSWGNPSMAIDGFCGCCNPVNFDMLPDGRFVTCEKGLPRIKVYSPEGNFESVVAGPEAFAQNAKSCSLNGLSNCRTGGMDVAVDSKGRVIVMDPVERVVRIFERV